VIREYPGTVDLIALVAESKIRTAMARGEFDNLPGHGRPLQPEDCSRVPPELRMGFRLLRNAGCLPPELEARKEVTRLGSLIAATGDPEERGRLSRLRADAELRYQLLVEHRRR
jgi:DnaJ homologue, subfamily C, member 28, conserved domain